MPAPTSNVRGTFKDSSGEPRNGVTVVFESLDSPFSSGGDVVTSSRISVTLDEDGQFGFDPLFPLVEGNYRVVVSDVDAFVIAVPGDGETHDIEDLAVDIGSSDLLTRKKDSTQVFNATEDTVSVSRTLKGDPNSSRSRFAFFGEGPILTDGILHLLVTAVEAHDIICLGNANPGGLAGTIDDNIGATFHSFILDYSGGYGSGSPDRNRFWYATGSEDWIPGNVSAVTDFLALEGNERYYKVVLNGVAIFVLSSDENEPDGNTHDSTQGAWLQTQLTDATERWKIVVFRDSPKASVSGYSAAWMDWPFVSWGADAVIAAGAKIYERIDLGGTTPLLVVGTAAETLDTVGTPVSGSEFRSATKGILVMDANNYSLKFTFLDKDGQIIDSTTILRSDGTRLSFNAIAAPGKGIKYGDDGLQLDFGSGDNQVQSGRDLFFQNEEGRTIRVDSIPTINQIRARPSLKNCLFVIGDDPPEIWYYNKAADSVELFLAPTDPTSQYNNTRDKLANPTFTPASGTAAGVVIDHADDTVQIYYSINGEDFQLLTDWPTDKRVLHATTGVWWIAAYARHNGYIDSDVVSAQFTAP